jgi:HEAT repeat protein
MKRWWQCSLLTIALIAAGCAAANKQPMALKDWPKPAPPPAVPPQRPEALDSDLQSQAKAEIRLALTSNDPHVRVIAIEAAQDTLGQGAHELVAAALDDKDPNVRFAGAMAAGRLKFQDLHNKLLELANDPVIKVQIGVRFGLHKLGDTHLSHDLEKMAQNPNPRVREDVAMILGQLGEPTGLKVLKGMLVNETDDSVRIQIAESRWRLGDVDAVETLCRGLVSINVDDQMLSIIGLTGPKDRRVEGYIRGKLTDPYTEIALVAARGMGDLGYDAGYPVALKSIRSPDARQRFLAAYALGAIGRSDAQSSLSPLLKDSEARVRVAAAKAILQLKAPDVAVTQAGQ